MEHKMVIYKYLINRINALLIADKNKKQQLNKPQWIPNTNNSKAVQYWYTREERDTTNVKYK